MRIQRKIRQVLIFSTLISLMISCGSVSNPDVERKLDPQLRMAYKEQKVKDTSKVNCTIQISRNYDDEIKKQLEKAGIIVLSNFVSILTAEGSLSAIFKAAELDFIIRIESDKPLFPIEQ